MVASHAVDELAEVLRVAGGRALATLTRVLGDITLAEDSLAEATIEALRRWPASGIPRSPAAWLVTVGRNRARDHQRREARRSAKEEGAVRMLQPEDPTAQRSSCLDDGDDLLRLLFTCCHPALAPEARVALSLRTLCGLTTAEVARALLVSESTMAQRLVRTKAKIARARIPYRVPDDHELPDRLPAVLTVVYSVFTAGHSATAGDELVRVDLCDEGIRLGRLLVALMPDEPEAAGLLALMLLTDARRSTRTDAAGEVVLLADQDRSRWDQAMIGEGSQMVADRMRVPSADRGPMVLQAAIAAHHASAPSFAETDWPAIVELYDALAERQPTPVVLLNRAVAVGELRGAEAGLAEVDRIEGLERFHLFHASRAELLFRTGRHDEAVAAFDEALACEPPAMPRRFLERRRADVLAAAP